MRIRCGSWMFDSNQHDILYGSHKKIPQPQTYFGVARQTLMGYQSQADTKTKTTKGREQFSWIGFTKPEESRHALPQPCVWVGCGQGPVSLLERWTWYYSYGHTLGKVTSGGWWTAWKNTGTVTIWWWPWCIKMDKWKALIATTIKMH